MLNAFPLYLDYLEAAKREGGAPNLNHDATQLRGRAAKRNPHP